MIWTLAARAAAAECESAAAATRTAAASAAELSALASERGAVAAEASGSEALRELSGGRIELSERDGLRAIVQLSAVEARRIGAAGNRDGVGLRVLQ